LCHSPEYVLERAITGKYRMAIKDDKESEEEMIAVVKALVLALAVTGLASAGVVATPLNKAIDIHKNHLGPDSKLPENAMKGQQNALDHLMKNQARWLQNQNNTSSDDRNETAEPDEVPETD
jgi:hypothetical protein